MMKAISVYDLQLIPELAHLTVFDMVHPSNDKLVNPFLGIMGFDLDYPLHYTVSQHRTIQNTVKVGYVIRGEVSITREHLTGPWATMDDRVAAAAYTDASFARELCAMMNRTNFTATRGADSGPHEDFPAELCDPNEERIAGEIQQLEDILLQIRGSQFKEDGNRKMPEDYFPQPKVEEKPKRKRLTRKDKQEA